MLITALLGSPRKQGSTARIISEILRGTEENGAHAKVYYLNDLNLKSCQSCHSCIHRPMATCAIQDDANKILDDISKSDGVIFGTPVYMASMTGLMKIMVDRLYPFLRSDNTSKMEPGKKALWVITQKQPDVARYLPVFEKLKYPMNLLGFADCKIFIVGGTPSPEQLLTQPEALIKANNLGTWLTKRLSDNVGGDPENE